MQVAIRPAAEWEVTTLISDAASRNKPLEIMGAGTKRVVGRAFQAVSLISTTSIKGITLYEPAELVMSARSGTPLEEIESELAKRSQTLPFEPLDLGPVVGSAPKRGTIGGVFATNLGGSRRIATGAPRDHLIGLRAVTGKGELMKSGGRVMKNVTGYDLARGLSGSWGTLAITTEVTFKVVPMPEQTATVVLHGLTDELAVEVMTQAMGTPYEVTGAVHIPSAMAARLKTAEVKGAGEALTALRLENFEAFVSYRAGKLRELFAPYGSVEVLGDGVSRQFWGELRQLSILQGGNGPLWRISTAPKSGPKVVASVGRYMPVNAFYDGSGGLIWLEVPDSADAGATDIRRVIAQYGGHATLIRADVSVRAAVDVFQPLEPGVERLTRGLKGAFDPVGILNPGRMYAAI
jgi:glycolate oxidase FAD binding subunit